MNTRLLPPTTTPWCLLSSLRFCCCWCCRGAFAPSLDAEGDPEISDHV